MTDETPGLVRLATSLTDHVPAAVEDLVAPLYYRYNGWQADRDHREPTLTAARTADAPDHVLLVVVDALRPDAVPDCGLPFSHAVTLATWTFPAMTSVHTGTYPHEHGAAVHTHPDSESVAMPAQHDSTSTLAHVHEAAGYETYAGCVRSSSRFSRHAGDTRRTASTATSARRTSSATTSRGAAGASGRSATSTSAISTTRSNRPSGTGRRTTSTPTSTCRGSAGGPTPTTPVPRRSGSASTDCASTGRRSTTSRRN